MARRSFTTRAYLGLYTETPLHCGAESGSGYVDLPIQRERHSHFPMIPGSTIKGVLRNESDWNGKTDAYFGPRFGESDARNPGTISFSDGFVVAFPIRSTKEPFVWVTCPIVLERTLRSLEMTWPDKLPSLSDEQAWSKGTPGEIVLEELAVTVVPAPPELDAVVTAVASLLPTDPAFNYTRGIFPARLVVVSDQNFGQLVETGTEVLTRIAIDPVSGTTTGEKGHMFNEELVPRDTLFLCVLREIARGTETPFPLDLMPPTIRLGGEETIGRGVTWVRTIEAKGA